LLWPDTVNTEKDYTIGVSSFVLVPFLALTYLHSYRHESQWAGIELTTLRLAYANVLRGYPPG